MTVQMANYQCTCIHILAIRVLEGNNSINLNNLTKRIFNIVFISLVSVGMVKASSQSLTVPENVHLG